MESLCLGLLQANQEVATLEYVNVEHLYVMVVDCRHTQGYPVKNIRNYRRTCSIVKSTPKREVFNGSETISAHVRNVQVGSERMATAIIYIVVNVGIIFAGFVVDQE